MDINPFAVELAKVTMMIGRKLAIDELHITEPALPLDNLDANFRACDALIDPAGNPTPWPKVDAIIGNPPFLGAKRLKPERGPDYVNAIRRAYPDVPGMADYCVYWFRKAHDHLPACTAEDPVSGRAGLVGTQNVRNNQSRVGGLDHIVRDRHDRRGGRQPALVGRGQRPCFDRRLGQERRDAKVLPDKRRLWYKVEPPAGSKKPRKRGSGPASKDFQVDSRRVRSSSIRHCRTRPTCRGRKSFRRTCGRSGVFKGSSRATTASCFPSSSGRNSCDSDPNSRRVVKPYLVGRDLVSGTGRPTRFVIDFRQRGHLRRPTLRGGVLARSAHRLAGSPEYREAAPRRPTWLPRGSNTWIAGGSFGTSGKGLRTAIRRSPRYLACSRVTKRPILCFVARSILPDNAIEVFAFADDYSFGILAVERPLAVVRGEVLEADRAISLHAGVGFRHLSLAAAAAGQAGRCGGGGGTGSAAGAGGGAAKGPRRAAGRLSDARTARQESVERRPRRAGRRRAGRPTASRPERTSWRNCWS